MNTNRRTQNSVGEVRVYLFHAALGIVYLENGHTVKSDGYMANQIGNHEKIALYENENSALHQDKALHQGSMKTMSKLNELHLELFLHS